MHIDDDDRHQLAQEERVNRIYEAGAAPAFPLDLASDNLAYGLTIRQYFAIKIMAGLVANSAATGEDAPVYARMAVFGADALLAELNK